MASSYVKALISRESGIEKEAISYLNNSLTNLFEHFFPGKSFEGVIPTKEGTLEFPVKLKTGEKHDITELSSGEKEVLFGYLRLKNQAPKNSVILIDEPELHLNPKLAKKLPEFYFDTIGIELNNQIWLVTHSDAILKESVGNKKFNVFYMSESQNDNKNQAKELSETEIETALIDLIGDLSSYQHGNKVVIFEGMDSEFDKKMTNDLFPEFENSVNSISAGSRTNVTNIQSVLKAASEEGIISKKFISIVDRDSGKVTNDIESLEFSWDVYHIENYLLNEAFILKTLIDLGLTNSALDSEAKVLTQLKECAQETMNFHVRHELYLFVSNEVQSSFRSNINDKNPLNEEFYKTVESTILEMESKKVNSLSQRELYKKERFIQNKYQNALKDETWKSVYNGRNILKRFVGKHCEGIRYEQFRNLLISKMKHERFKPTGMKKIIDEILKI
ncbi:MAG: ATP-binding protein [Ignavibacteriae bacterium]|nr:ATP-binding protein [Ignavibacteriota bacterium]